MLCVDCVQYSWFHLCCCDYIFCPVAFAQISTSPGCNSVYTCPACEEQCEVLLFHVVEAKVRMEATEKAGYLDKVSIGLDVAASEFKVLGLRERMSMILISRHLLRLVGMLPCFLLEMNLLHSTRI